MKKHAAALPMKDGTTMTSALGPAAASQATRRYWAVVAAIVVAGVTLRAPALHAGLYADDWDHYAIQQQIYPVELPAWDMFNWVSDRASERDALLRSGRIPWWASRNLHLSVFRPLASLLAYFDYAVLDGVHHPERLHLHTLCWWIALLLGVAALLGSILPLPIAATAVLIYAVDDCHIFPFAWIANRSELIALAFVIWAVTLQIRAEQRASIRLRVAAGGLLLLGLCAGEHALPPMAFIPVSTLFSSGASWRRLRGLLPLGLLVVSYIFVRASLGYGVAGSAYYIDPFAEPSRYLAAALTRLPVLLADLAFAVPSEWWPLGPSAGFFATLAEQAPRQLWPGLQLSLGAVAAMLCFAGLRWLRHSQRHLGVPALQWLFAGALVSLLPLCGMIPLGRMTIAPAIAFDAVLAYCAWAATNAAIETPERRARLLLLALLGFVLTLAILVPAQRSRDGAHFLNGLTNSERRWIDEADYGVENLRSRHLFVLSARDLASQMSIPYIRHASGQPMPQSVRTLTPWGDRPQYLTRISDTAIEIESAEPTRDSGFYRGVYRSENDRLSVGEEISSLCFDVSIIETRDGEPTHLRFDFKAPLDSPAFLFMVSHKSRFERFVLPDVGQRVLIAAAQGP